MQSGAPGAFRILAIDTTMGGCAVGVYDTGEQRTLCAQSIPMTTGQAERLVPMIEQVLEDAKTDYKDLAAIAVTRGPGAFTGLRIGLSTAKALSLALEIPAIGIETFEALLKSLKPEQPKKTQATIAILIETKRNDYYARLYQHDGRPLTEGASCTLENILPQITEKEDICLVGDAVARFTSEAQKRNIPPHWDIKEITMCDPAAIAKCAAKQLLEHPEKNSFDTSPLYLRAPDVTAPAKFGNIILQ